LRQSVSRRKKLKEGDLCTPGCLKYLRRKENGAEIGVSRMGKKIGEAVHVRPLETSHTTGLRGKKSYRGQLLTGEVKGKNFKVLTPSGCTWIA